MPTLLQQLDLLRAERDYERDEFRRETETYGIRRKVKRGDCWFPARLGRSYYNAMNRLVVEIYRDHSEDVEHNFEYGRTVQFFQADAVEQLSYASFTGVVSYAESERMVVVLPDESALSRLVAYERWGVQLGFDETSYQLMTTALQRTMAAKDGSLAHLRNLVHGSEKPAFGALPSTLRWPWLNESQQEAVRRILVAHDVMVVHGPPGTGKTTTLVEAVSEVLRRETQVLVCAQSNMAVDWISEQLSDRGLSVLRLGNPTRVTDKMLSFTYERRFENHPSYSTLWAIRRTIRQLYDQSHSRRSESFHQKVARLREKADELEWKIRTELFDTSRVIACTLAGSASPLLQATHFHTLFVDEAAQAMEAACWIAMQKCDRVILAGDHCQLPPTIKSPAALKANLGQTLMEQLVEKHPSAVSMLNVQYRMSEELMRFSSEWFYHGELKAAPMIRERSILSDIENPLVWIDTSSLPADDGSGEQSVHEEYVGLNYGRINKPEAQAAIRVLHEFVSRVSRQRLIEENIDIGIISPYRAQIQYMRQLVRRSDYLKPLRKQITINTVDSFQGQERDVILISMVRSNEQGEIGFLRDLRRMNVAITRARYKVIVLGAAETLCRHAFYRRLYESCVLESLSSDDEKA